MASAVEQLTNGYNTSQPVSFEDYYAAYGKDKYGDKFTNVNPNGFFGKFHNFWTGDVSSAKQSYENYLSGYQFSRDQAAKKAENAWTAQREDSQVQRAVKDIQAAGLNPWLALNGGSMSSAMVSSQSASARYKVREEQLKQDSKKANLLGTALKVLMALAIMS